MDEQGAPGQTLTNKQTNKPNQTKQKKTKIQSLQRKARTESLGVIQRR